MCKAGPHCLHSGRPLLVSTCTDLEFLLASCVFSSYFPNWITNLAKAERMTYTVSPLSAQHLPQGSVYGGLINYCLNKWMDGWVASQTRLKESEVTQSCPTLCDPVDCSLLGSSVHGIFQARVLEGVPFPSPGDLPNPGIEARSSICRWILLPAEPPGKLDCVSLPLATLFTFCSGCINIVHIDMPV